MVFCPFAQSETLNFEEKYNSLQEEAAIKTKKMKKLYCMLMQAKSEVRLNRRKESADILSVCLSHSLPLHIFLSLSLLSYPSHPFSLSLSIPSSSLVSFPPSLPLSHVSLHPRIFLFLINK